MTRIAILYAGALLALVLVADFGWLEEAAIFINAHPPFDKAIHFIMYGVLALLVNAALMRHRSWPPLVSVAVGSLIVLAVSTLEEYSNALVVHRTCSLADWAANVLGIVCIGSLALWFAGRSIESGEPT